MNQKLKQAIRYIREEYERQQEKCKALDKILRELQEICPHEEVEVTHTYRGEFRRCKVCGYEEMVR